MYLNVYKTVKIIRKDYNVVKEKGKTTTKTIKKESHLENLSSKKKKVNKNLTYERDTNSLII